ncbi:MAG: EamA family transporter [Sedimentibacter sp.]
MKKKDIILALLLVTIWGVNFTVIKLGLGGVPSMLLVSLRYVFTVFPAIFFIKKPNTEWKYIIMYGLFVGVGQFACLFLAMEIGMPASIASIVLQIQSFISPVLAMIFLNEKLKAKQVAGFAVAAAGLVIIGIANTKSGIDSIPFAAIALNLLAPVFWAASNIVARIASDKAAVNGEKLDMFGLVVWSGLIPPLPLLGMALLLDSPETIWNIVTNLSSISIFSILYLAFGATLFGYGVWSVLLGKYPMSKVAPLPLTVPVIALLSAGIVLKEQLSSMQWLGVTVILIGLIVTNLNIETIINHFKKVDNKV